jgi:hypothetical protein
MNWALQSLADFTAGGIAGGGVGLFRLSNRRTGDSRQLTFSGAGLVGGLSLKSPKGAEVPLPGFSNGDDGQNFYTDRRTA